MARYSIGIDLGTTNSAVSYFNLDDDKPRGRDQTMMGIPQVTSPGIVEDRTLLPSFLYLPADDEFPPASLGLPWDPRRKQAVAGEFARAHGAKVPMRLVSSAKSWLCYSGVDRQGPILPWQAPEGVKRVSPLEASAQLLAHLREVWNVRFKGSPVGDQEIVLTVPASFDAAARDLTLAAAKQAGLTQVTLLEEPQAAFYAWAERMGDGFRKEVRAGDVVLVVDVGGGTTDFSLIAVTDQDGDLQLTRIAVGDHILLGGDNMDLALAHTVSQRLAAEGKTLDSWQFNALTFACRQAKESMAAKDSLKEAPLVVPGRGASIIGGTIKTVLSRSELVRVLVDGFFPKCPASDGPQLGRRGGLSTFALPYAHDPGITRHLAGFLTRQAGALAAIPGLPPARGRSFIHPSAILFNGGVFKAELLKNRVREVLDGWLAADGGKPAKELQGADLDLAVARGAAYYGWSRHGRGLRIRGGTARAYYVGVESAAPAVPGVEPAVRALCVAPFGMEEGTHADVPQQEFGLVVGEPTRFRFFSSSVRRADSVGTVLEDPARNAELEEVSPIETTLPSTERGAGQLAPVNLQAAVTALGTLELRCLEKGGPGKWKLELNVRMKE